MAVKLDAASTLKVVCALESYREEIASNEYFDVHYQQYQLNQCDELLKRFRRSLKTLERIQGI